jgi:hypothetical protein
MNDWVKKRSTDARRMNWFMFVARYKSNAPGMSVTENGQRDAQEGTVLVGDNMLLT